MSDLISRQAALDAIQQRADRVDSVYSAFWEGLIIAQDIVENIPSAEPVPKWTPVTEALPEEDMEVLVTVRFDGTQDVKPSVYVETASQIGGTWTSYTDEWKVSPSKHHVIAWMPLPEPWRGE